MCFDGNRKMASGLLKEKEHVGEKEEGQGRVTGRTVEDLPQVSGGLALLLGTLVFGALVFVGSWRLSIRWYDKREFRIAQGSRER